MSQKKAGEKLVEATEETEGRDRGKRQRKRQKGEEKATRERGHFEGGENVDGVRELSLSATQHMYVAE